MIIVNGFQPLTIITKCSALDVFTFRSRMTDAGLGGLGNGRVEKFSKMKSVRQGEWGQLE